MLAFDIETTGLNMKKDTVTVVALYGTVAADDDPVDMVLNFARDGKEAHRVVLLDLMGRAHSLCAFNGVRFDIPFLMSALDIPSEVCSAWVAKLCDPFEVSDHPPTCPPDTPTLTSPCLPQKMKLLYDTTMSLNRLLGHFHMETKCASGAEAVVMASEKRWPELELYCRQDTVLTHKVALRLAEEEGRLRHILTK